MASALPSPPQNKSTYSKGKADLATWPTSKHPSALPPPHKNKSPHTKGKAGPDPLTISKL
eukprot:CAMPEP_0196638130 /NCGR_PEP_ID=MMETSP1085-20130531/992_1 /TAXON_ID=41879 ORGANISM="Pycnococcus sp, Strain CCMP1998" /NCGR_SAMPLE_ID=MMETSP1085 /ASSEMBLY_ACC=CAM_ASM_000807 /LENGTH=59 /DNA_ID=CAMNT_0041966831 /DNA_START=213 /DNA_END=389 /DNA_ORIENTATION=+